MESLVRVRTRATESGNSDGQCQSRRRREGHPVKVIPPDPDPQHRQKKKTFWKMKICLRTPHEVRSALSVSVNHHSRCKLATLEYASQKIHYVSAHQAAQADHINPRHTKTYGSEGVVGICCRTYRQSQSGSHENIVQKKGEKYRTEQSLYLDWL